MLIRLDAKYQQAYSSRATAWWDKKDYDRAIKDYDVALQLNPQDAGTFNNRGNAWKAKKDFVRAIKDYDRAIQINPNFGVAYHNRSSARTCTWVNTTGPSTTPTRPSGSNPRCPWRITNAVWPGRTSGFMTRPLRITVKRSDPTLADGGYYVNRGTAWRQKKEYDRAIKDYDEAIRINPKIANAFVGRAAVWTALKEYDKAIADCAWLRGLEHDNAGAYCNRAVAARQAKEI